MTLGHDVVVLGAGPAGANAALTVAAAGLRVALIDEQPHPGGQVWRAKSESILCAPPTPESVAGDALRAAVDAAPVMHLGDCRVWHLERDGDLWRTHAVRQGTCSRTMSRALILATGAREHVVPIPGWTLPGVLGLAGATALLKQSLVPPGDATVVAGTGPLVFFVASEIRRLGGRVTAVVTPNSVTDWMRALPAMLARRDLLGRGSVWMADLVAGGVPIHWRHAVERIDGHETVEAVRITRLCADWAPAGGARTLCADSLCLGNGLVPSVGAAQLAGLPLRYRPALGGWAPEVAVDGRTSLPGLFVCGDGTGIRGAAAAQIQGRLAGLSAASYLGAGASKACRARLVRDHARATRFGLAMTALSTTRPGLMRLVTPRTVVCRCESLTRKAIEDEIGAGARTTNAVKSGTRAGMGPCGGRFCQTIVARLIETAHGLSEGSVAPPTARPPLRPVTVEALAGRFHYGALPIPEPAPL